MGREQRIAAAVMKGLLDSFLVIRDVARAIGYTPDKNPLRSTEGNTWYMSSNRDFLELQVGFGRDGKVSVYALPMDPNEQEAIAEQEDVEVSDPAELVELVKRVKNMAAGKPILRHLQIEQGLNRY